jgi:hypothetical protein
MRIEVVVNGWEQACCGVPVELGEPATFTLVALDPAAGLAPPPTLGVPRFTVDNHGQTPADVPQRRLEGVVAGITGVAYPSVPVVGRRGVRTADSTRPELSALTSIGEGEDAELNEYRVLLDLPDDTVLPDYVVSEERRGQREGAARTAELVGRRTLDQVGLLLRALADDADGRRAEIASTEQSDAASAVSIVPNRVDAAAVHWQRSAEDDDGIQVQIGDGSWLLPATAEGAAVLREFLEAAVAGRVEELVLKDGEAGGGLPSALLTRVTAADGRSWTATIPLDVFGDSPVMASTRKVAQRLQGGDIRHPAWA